MSTRIRQKLAVLIEDRVRSQAGLKDVSLGLGDLVILGTEVAAALERDVDGLVKGQTVRRPIVLGARGNRERADEGSRRWRERLRLRCGDRCLERRGRRCRRRVHDRGGYAFGRCGSGPITQESAGARQIAKAAAPGARGVSHDGISGADIGQGRAGSRTLGLDLAVASHDPESQDDDQNSSQPMIHHCMGSLPGPVGRRASCRLRPTGKLHNRATTRRILHRQFRGGF